MVFTAWPDGRFEIGQACVRAALGRSGVVAAADKREGDGASPAGIWAIRHVFYRPDKGPPPVTGLSVRPIAPEDGWCDDAADAAYNRLVRRPYGARCEVMWRDDDLYDLVVVLGHNDDPPVAGLGSAIFVHLARAGYAPTEGCVALSRGDMEALLAAAKPGDAVEIKQSLSRAEQR